MAQVTARLGGYAPADSTHGQALDRIAAELRSSLGAGVDVSIDYNILDRGQPIQDLLAEVEAGDMTLCFFSSSYLADQVPGLGIVDLPYVFDSLADAHAALDGPFGAALSDLTRQTSPLEPLGYWDNGFRHISTRSRVVRTPDDCRELKIRLQPNRAHERYFRALGAEPVCNDLREGIAMLMSGELDAQENPLANYVAYGVHKVHPHVTLTGHIYGARGVYASTVQLRDWPDEACEALAGAARAAIAQQRDAAVRKEAELRTWLTDLGVQIVELTDDEVAAFRAVAQPILAGARERFDAALWSLLDGRR